MISNSLVPVHFKAQEIIYEFNSISQVFFLLKTGKVEVQTFINIEEKNRWPISTHTWNERKVISKYVYPVKIVQIGEFFGEYELILKNERKTRAVAIENTTCLSLNKNDFFRLLSEKEQKGLLEIIKLNLPSEEEMEKKIRKSISSRTQNDKILFEAMKITYLPIDKDCLTDKRSKKLKK